MWTPRRAALIWDPALIKGNTVYETLYQNIRKILSIIYQNKTKIPGKNRKCLVWLWEIAKCVNYSLATPKK